MYIIRLRRKKFIIISKTVSFYIIVSTFYSTGRKRDIEMYVLLLKHNMLLKC